MVKPDTHKTTTFHPEQSSTRKLHPPSCAAFSAQIRFLQLEINTFYPLLKNCYKLWSKRGNWDFFSVAEIRIVQDSTTKWGRGGTNRPIAANRRTVPPQPCERGPVVPECRLWLHVYLQGVLTPIDAPCRFTSFAPGNARYTWSANEESMAWEAVIYSI